MPENDSVDNNIHAAIKIFIELMDCSPYNFIELRIFWFTKKYYKPPDVTT